MKTKKFKFVLLCVVLVYTSWIMKEGVKQNIVAEKQKTAYEKEGVNPISRVVKIWSVID